MGEPTWKSYKDDRNGLHVAELYGRFVAIFQGVFWMNLKGFIMSPEKFGEHHVCFFPSVWQDRIAFEAAPSCIDGGFD